MKCRFNRFHSTVLTLLLAPVLLSSRLDAQLIQNSITIIPTVNTTTGAPTSPGTFVYRDVSGVFKTLTITIPSTLTSGYTITLPQKPSAIGCMTMDTSGTIAIDTTCTGASGSGLWLNSGANPNNVFLANTNYSVQKLPVEDQTATTGNTNETITAGAGQSGDLLDIVDNAGTTKHLYVESTGNLNLGQITKFNTGSSLNWEIDAVSSNLFTWRNSSSVQVMQLDNTGTSPPGVGTVLFAPTIYAQATNAVGVALRASGFTSGSADIFTVNSSGGTQYLWVDHSGTTHVATCSGCAPADMMTTDTGQTVTGSKTFNATQDFQQNVTFDQAAQFTQGGGGFQFQWHVPSSNTFTLENGSSLPIINIDQTGVGATPTVAMYNTHANSPILQVTPNVMGSTGDLFQAYTYALGTKAFWIDASGGTHINSCVSGCGSGVTSISGQAGPSITIAGGTGISVGAASNTITISNTGITSIGVTSPITSTGGASPNIGCVTCVTTNTTQTITGQKLLQSTLITGTMVVQTGIEIQPLTNGNANIGDNTHYFGNGYIQSMNVSVVNWDNGLANLTLAGGATFQANVLMGSNTVFNTSAAFVGPGGVNTTGTGTFAGTLSVTSGSNINITGGGVYQRGGVGGVSCAGPPTAAFATSGGIVTHC